MRYLLILAFALSAAVLRAEEPVAAATIPFPEIKLMQLDSVQQYDNSILKKDYRTVFINFSPTCDHCQRTIESILKNIARFPQTQFVLTSFDSMEAIRTFYFNYNLSAYTNVYVGQEIAYSMTKQLKYAGFPSVVLFDQSGKWLHSVHEVTNAKNILKQYKLPYK